MIALNALQGDDFQTKGFLISTAEALRAFLGNRDEVVSLTSAISTGEVTDAEIESFVRDLLQSFHAGTKFSDEITLAAIAVALERVPTTFAEKYLENLANLQIQEIPLAWRVARLSLSRRHEILSGRTDALLVISLPFPNLLIGPREERPRPIDARYSNDELRMEAAS